MIERRCRCGKSFMAREADVARGWAKSCSKRCAALNRKGRRRSSRIVYSRYMVDEDFVDEGPEGWDGHKS